MAQVRKTPAAETDLVGIWRYIADDSPDNADRFLDRIEESLHLLAENPQMGRKREKLSARLRSFPVGDYVLFYRPLDEEKGIEVVRVLNAAQDISGSRF